MQNEYLRSSIKQFEFYKLLGEKAIQQLTNEELFWQYNDESNSVAALIKHLWGNMLSRWTDFLTTDGEKPWRTRDAEFENDLLSKIDLLQKWEDGWNCLFAALNCLKEEDLSRIIYIRNQGHTVTEAINRQLTHYAYHIGQIVFIGKILRGSNWNSLSIPKGASESYNAQKFSEAKQKTHFTEEFLRKK